MLKKKLRTLLTLDLGWAYRFGRKRLHQKLKLAFAKTDHYDVRVGDIKIRLEFTTPYHHSIAQSMSEGSWPEVALLPHWVEAAKSSSVIFDVGGFNGIYALLAKKANPGAEVYIFEPDRFSLEHIKRNAKANNVSLNIVEAAASDREGSVHFDGSGSSGSKIAEWGKNTIPTITLRSFGSPDLMKIDIEGHEPEALAGADLKNTKTLIVEMNHKLEIPFKEVFRVGNTALMRR